MLSDFFRHPGWALYSQGLAEKLQQAVREVLGEQEMFKVARIQGRAAAFEEAINLGSVLLSKPRRPS